MTVEISEKNSFEQAVSLLGYEEMLNRTISVAAMILGEVDSTSTATLEPAWVRYRGKQRKGWIKETNEAFAFPVGPAVPDNELGLDTTFIRVSVNQKTGYSKKRLVPQSLGSLSIGDSFSPDFTVVLKTLIGNEREKIVLPDDPSVVLYSGESFIRTSLNRETVEKAANQLSYIISHNGLQTVGPMQRTLDEYHT